VSSARRALSRILAALVAAPLALLAAAGTAALPAGANYTPLAETCGDLFTPIYVIQGDGAASPLAGTEVALEGVVVGDFQNNTSLDDGDLNGFHVQDPIGDAKPMTSDGVFVYAPGGIDVAAGDAVRVRGAVSEYNGMTEVTASQIWVCSSGNSVAPAPLSLPVTNLDEFEAYEGMLVTFPQALVISEYFDYDRYGEIVLTSERLSQPTATYEPGSPEALALVDLISRDRITLDDGRTVWYPDPAIHPNGAVFDLGNLFRGGDTLTSVTGTVDYRYGSYRIQPTAPALYAAANPRPATPLPVEGSLRVASFNVLNYFTTIDTGAHICGPAGDQECRGADTPEEFTRQRSKIIAALAAIDADVVALIEIENHPGDAPVADLVAGLNDLVGAGTYSYIATGATGIDVIRQALIFKPATVMPLGPFAVLEDPTFTNPRGYLAEDGTLDQMNRPALAQSFLQRATEGVVTVAVNHLKSRSSPCGQGDDDPHQGNCNLTRTLGAQALASWLATDPTGSGDPDVLVIGDLNAYSHEDPIAALTAAGYTDTLGLLLGDYAYSYVYDGQAGHLDYALAGPGLRTTGQVAGVTIWHINADEPQLIDYDMTLKSPAHDALYAPDPYRSSDHDPVIIGLMLTGPANRVYLPLVLR